MAFQFDQHSVLYVSSAQQAFALGVWNVDNSMTTRRIFQTKTKLPLIL